jgi:hypothetical protein
MAQSSRQSWALKIKKGKTARKPKESEEEKSGRLSKVYKANKEKARYKRLCLFLFKRPDEAQNYEDRLLDEGVLIRNQKGIPIVNPAAPADTRTLKPTIGKPVVDPASPAAMKMLTNGEEGKEDDAKSETGTNRNKRRIADYTSKELAVLLTAIDKRLFSLFQLRAIVPTGCKDIHKDTALKLIDRITNVNVYQLLGWKTLSDIDGIGE